jgi:ubiquinone/menaquinone biosynthesis C-methylase UbiE
MSTAHDAALPASYSFYHQRNLGLYDFWVLGFNCRFVWRCPASRLEKFFLENVTPNHCDIGIGTGYFLSRAQRKRRLRQVHLVDGSADCIAWVRRRVTGVAFTSQQADVLEDTLQPPRLPVDSVSMNFLLHCLRGPLERKRRLFANARRVARPGATIFGSTVLGRGADHGLAARLLLPRLNRNGMFDTRDDDRRGVETMLHEETSQLETRVIGSVLLFRGTLSDPAGLRPS